MSQDIEIPSLHDKLYVCSFHGGERRGRCIQLTLKNGRFVQLTETEVSDLLVELTKWLNKSEVE